MYSDRSKPYIAKKVVLRTQNPRSELRRSAPQLASWVLVCTNQLLLCYISMWRQERRDLDDSTVWVRNIRENEWSKGNDESHNH